ncbi:hypothetical protein C2G38_2084635 [Gigaspora rosea]|uniref:Uncharacterized protein n=1 Tax=Gigaspora rosea TaxID=44941 RepID=A0A397VAX7_9GLOM|nr:hypothetical protein C2G38_2084635 [Gigaspora rosea]
MTCKINDKGYNLIKKFEGFRSDYYVDPAGNKTITMAINIMLLILKLKVKNYSEKT